MCVRCGKHPALLPLLMLGLHFYIPQDTLSMGFQQNYVNYFCACSNIRRASTVISFCKATQILLLISSVQQALSSSKISHRLSFFY